MTHITLIYNNNYPLPENAFNNNNYQLSENDKYHFAFTIITIHYQKMTDTTLYLTIITINYHKLTDSILHLAITTCITYQKMTDNTLNLAINSYQLSENDR